MPAKKKKVIASTPARIRPRYFAHLAVLWTAAFLAYSNSFDLGLVFDNALIIGGDPRIRAASPENIGLIFTKEYWYPAANSGLYRPFSTLSYLFNYSLLGDETNPAGYHWVNLALHEVNIALVYTAGILILGSPAAAFALAALWAVHPLLTESVTNIVGRADLLAAFGVLAGLVCHIRAVSASGRRRIAWLAALAGAQTVGLFSKESAAILPGVMLLYDFCFAPRFAWRGWRERIANYAVLLVPFAAFFLLRSRVDTHMAIGATENPLIAAGFVGAKMTAIKVLGKLLWLFVWPARLSADYSYNAIPVRAFDLGSIAAVLACAGLVALAICFRERKALVFFVGFFFLALAPTSNLLFPIGTIMAERFMYLTSFALCGSVIIALEAIRGQAAIKWGVIGVVCLALGVRTWARNADWHDGVTLWSSAAAAYPDDARAHYNLGEAWAERSEPANALPEFEAALRIRPDYRNAHVSLANALEKLPDRLPDAIANYQAALREDPGFAPGHYNLGTALARDGRAEEAIAEWQAAVRLDPDLALAHYNLAIVYARQGHFDQAVTEYQAALRLRPQDADAHFGLGGVYWQLHRPEEAFREIETSLRIHPDAERQRTLDQLRAR